jgi:hypothetical protein
MRCYLLILIVVSLTAPQDAKKPALTTFHGQVISLAEHYKKQGIEFDEEAAPQWLALKTDDGKLYPLVPDGGAKLFLRDKQLLNRPVRIEGRILPGTQLLQIVIAYTMKDGKPHEVYYWCEVCAIKRYAQNKGNICDCCGGQMERREEEKK